jgi:hypothetical protein
MCFIAFRFLVGIRRIGLRLYLLPMYRHWLNTTLILLLISSALSAQNAADSSECEIPAALQLKLLAMSFQDFDQGGEGWRTYEVPVCYATTARLIDRYSETKGDLTPQQNRALRFHSGQL